MTQFQYYLAIVAGGIAAASLVVGAFGLGLPIGLQVFAWASVLLLARFVVPVPVFVDCLAAGFGLGALLAAAGVEAGPSHWLALIAVWLMTWLALERSATHRAAMRWRVLLPIVFGLILLILWEVIVTWGSVPRVILPPPSAIWARILVTSHLLWADFQQTFLKSVLAGYAIGCGAGFVVAILIDRSDFLRRGLMPVGNFVSALPIVGIAPIMVMWFGFDWQSKAAVVVVMTFFPMLVNTLAGLAVAGSMERDLMSTYAASPWQTLIKLRLPAAAPFIFNALKINSTLALIGAIVAEFFGTPTVGMGFRISTEVGRMNIDMVWAEIALAALAGSVFYGVVVLIERATTFWHPSVRSA